MAELYSVHHGRTKNGIKDKALIIANKHKCELYIKSREHTVPGFFVIRPAIKGAKTFIPKQKWKTGYVKNKTFNPHT